MNIGVKEVRDNLADALNRVCYQSERIVLERRGKGRGGARVDGRLGAARSG